MSRGVLPGATVASGSPWMNLSMPAVASRHDRTPGAPPRAPEKRQRRRKHCFTCILGPAARTQPFDGRRGLLEGSASSTGRASSSSRCALGPFVRRLASELSEWVARSFAKKSHTGAAYQTRGRHKPRPSHLGNAPGPGSGLGAAASGRRRWWGRRAERSRGGRVRRPELAVLLASGCSARRCEKG